jgi:hypothetical protein
MAIHNTSYDAANTAVRAFLTKVGAIYWHKTFNTGSGSGRTIWIEIKDNVFSQKCCYCGKHADKLQIEHLIMFNRQEYGLHHPGNVAPVCSDCNKRSNGGNGKHLSWEEHLIKICQKNRDIKSIDERKLRILHHINMGKYAYPRLTENEKNAIRVIAESLYNNVITETENSLSLYGKIAEAFVNKLKTKV